MSVDILLDENAFDKASADMRTLEARTKQLKNKLEKMYKNMTTALETPAGKQVDYVSKEVLIAPIEDLMQVILHVSDTLTEIIGTGYYREAFIKFKELNESIKFN